MQVHLLKSKIHRATVTGGNVNYEGSLTISADLMEKCGLQEYEKILCGNMANGNRWETYVIKGKRGSGEIIMNGAVAHLGKKGDLLTIMNFGIFTEAEAKRWKPRVIVLGKGNKIEPKSEKAAGKLPE
jgi:aspartate 1-decarboxylase